MTKNFKNMAMTSMKSIKLKILAFIIFARPEYVRHGLQPGRAATIAGYGLVCFHVFSTTLCDHTGNEPLVVARR